MKTIISDKEYTKDNAASRAAQRLLIAPLAVPARVTKASSWVMRVGTDSCHYRPVRIA